VNQLRYAQNSHAPVSCLPPELLAEVFLRIVESGLQGGNTRFAAGTFAFLQVCRRWNEIAVSSPRLWGQWVAGAVKAWPLFNTRSKDTPLSLTWRSHVPISMRDVLMDPAIPRRIRRLDFRGTSEELGHFLGAFDSSPPSNASSIRLQIPPHDDREPREHLTRFLSSPFPKLSHLNLRNFLPNPSSSIFTTSSLTSLKLYLSDKKRNRYTTSQFSQILRQHPNLRELDLNRGAIPLPGPSGASIPFTLPWLVSLRLYGTEAAILGFIDLIGMSSPLHDVDICFGSNPDLTVPALVGAVKTVLAAYYGCQGSSYPRKVNRLAISYNSEKSSILFNTRSHSTPTLDLKSNLKLQFDGTDALLEDVVVEETFPLFPLNDVHEFIAEGLTIYGLHGQGYRGMFQKMKHLSYLRLHKLDILPVLGALSSYDQGLFKIATETVSIHPHFRRWTASTNRPKVGVVDPISCRHPLRL
jgi:hypothetical protein